MVGKRGEEIKGVEVVQFGSISMEMPQGLIESQDENR